MAGNRHPLLILEIGKERVSMPTIDITMRKGCSDQAIENCLLQIPQAAEDILDVESQCFRGGAGDEF